METENQTVESEVQGANENVEPTIGTSEDQLHGSESQSENVEMGATSNDWTQDGRYKEMWSEDPNKLYSSYKNAEEKLQSLTTELKDYKNKSEQLSELQGISENWKQLENFFDSLSPEHSQQVLSSIEDVVKAQRRDQYGQDLPDEVLQKLESVEKLEQELQGFKNEQSQNEVIKVIDSKLEEANKISQQYGIEYDENEFLQYCKDNNVKPEYMDAVFLQQAMPYIKKSLVSKVSESTQNNLKSNMASSTINQSRSSNKELSPMAKLDKLLGVN